MLGHRTLNFEDYGIILKRRWWLLVLFTILGPVLALGVTYFITPKYTSETLVLIDQQKVPTDFVQPVATEALDSRLAIIDEQILSRSSLQPIIEKYNLYANQHLGMDERVELSRKDLKVEAVHSQIANSNGLPGFKIAFTANDPQTAQQVCGDITSLFTKKNLLAREASAAGTTDFLREQLSVATQNLNDLDQKVATFQKQYAGSLPEDQLNNTNIINSLNTSLDATTQRVQGLEQSKRVYETQLSLMQSSQVVSSSPTAVPPQTTQALQKELDQLLADKTSLETRYSADYPDVKDVNRRIADLQKELAKADAVPATTPAAAPVAKAPDTPNMVMLKAQITGLDQQIVAEQKQQVQIQQQIRAYEGRISMSPQVEAQYKELTRDYETAEAFQKRILGEMNQSEMTTSMENRQQGENFSILDAPNLPTEPIFPKKTIFAAGGLGVGLMFALLIIGLLEYKDTALRTERDIWDFTQLPTLAVIAWSGDVALLLPAKTPLLKRIFGRKPPNELLPDTTQ